MICRHAIVRLRYTNHTRRHLSTTIRLCNRHEPLDAASAEPLTPPLDPAIQNAGQIAPDITQPITIPDPTISDTLSEAAALVQPISDPLTQQLAAETVAGSADTVTMIAHGAAEPAMVATAWDSFSGVIGGMVGYMVWPMKTGMEYMGLNFWEASVADSMEIVSPLLEHAPAQISNFYMPWLLDHFQELTGTPWIFICIGTTILIRAALFKLTLRNMWGVYELPKEMQKQTVLQENIKYFNRTKQMKKSMKAQQALKQGKLNKYMWYMFLNGFLMVVPIRGTFTSLKNLEGLSVNEYGWVPDLTAPDPYYILPSIVVGNMVIMGLLNFRRHKYFNERTGALGLLGAGGMVWLMGGASAVMMQHYAISSTISMLTHGAREHKFLRTKLGLPPSEPVKIAPSKIPTVYQPGKEAPLHVPERAKVQKGMFGSVKENVEKRFGKDKVNVFTRIKNWFFMWKLKRHGAKGITTEFLEEKPPMPKFAPDAIVLVTDVTPELKKYVLRREHDTKTLAGTLATIEWMKRVQNQRWY